MTKKSERIRRRTLLKKRFHLFMILLILYDKKKQIHRLGNEIRDRANPLVSLEKRLIFGFINHIEYQEKYYMKYYL